MQTLAAFWQMQSALGNALYDAVFSGDLTGEEKAALCGTILDQFSDAFREFLPTYLTVLSAQYETYGKHGLEAKKGAVLSGANADRIKKACGMIKNGHDDLLKFLEDALSDPEDGDEGKAGSTTLSTKAASTSPEPGPAHSAAEDLSQQAEMIEELRAVIRQ